MTDDIAIEKIPVTEINNSSNNNNKYLGKCSSDLNIFLQGKFNKVLEIDPDLSKTIDHLKKSSSKAVIFGGWVRDRAIEFQKKGDFHSQDIDIVVTDIDQRGLEESLFKPATPNIFGGFSISTKNNKIDIWRLENTFSIKRFNLAKDIHVLPETTVFRINSIVFKPEQFWHESETFEHGCTSAIENNKIDFQSHMIPFPEIQAARALIYAAKLKFNLSQEVVKFIDNICVCKNDVHRIENGLREKCPSKFLMDAIELLRSIIEK